MRYSSFLSTLAIGLFSYPLWGIEPLFEHSHTYQELLESGVCSQTITLKRHTNGQRAYAWKIEGLKTGLKQNQGTLLFFNEKGKVLQEMEGYFDNRQFIAHGRWVYFSHKQAPLLTAFFQKGKLEGEMILFSTRGLIRTRKNFSNGLLHGPYAHFNEDGKPIEQGNYENGLLTGATWRFDDEGKIIEEISFQKGLPHGLCITLDHEKKRQIRRYYFFGFLHRMDGPALERIRPDQSHELDAYYRWSHPFGSWIYTDKAGLPHVIMDWKSPGHAVAYYKTNPSRKWQWQNGFLEPPCEIKEQAADHPQKSISIDWKFESGSKKAARLKLHYQDQLIESSLWQKNSHGCWLREGACQRFDPLKQALAFEKWTKGQLVEKVIGPSFFEKRSLDTLIKLYRKNDQSCLEFHDPKHPHITLQARFDSKGSLYSLISSQEGYSRSNNLDKYVGAEEIIDWSKDKGQLLISYKDTHNNPKERFLFEEKDLLQHCTWNNHLPEGDWSQKRKNPEKNSFEWVEQVFFKQGKREGSYRTWHTTGQLKYEGNYQNGLREGTHKNFFDSGKIFFSQKYEHDRAHGPREVFDPSGNLILKANYHNDLLNGPFWHKLTQGQVIEATFSKGHLEGFIKAYYAQIPTKSKPKVAFEGHYKKGKRHGLFKDYHENGQLLQTLNYEDNFLEGEALQYHLNGQKALQAFFQKGKKEGCWKQFNNKAILIRLIHFQRDLEHGQELLYNDNGQLCGENEYKNGFLDGFQRRYDANGSLVYEANYVEGKLHGSVRKYHEKQKTWVQSRFEHGELIEKQKDMQKAP